MEKRDKLARQIALKTKKDLESIDTVSMLSRIQQLESRLSVISSMETQITGLNESIFNLNNKILDLENRLADYETHKHDYEDATINDTADGTGTISTILKTTQGVKS